MISMHSERSSTPHPHLIDSHDIRKLGIGVMLGLELRVTEKFGPQTTLRAIREVSMREHET